MLPPISDPIPIGEQREDTRPPYPPELPPVALSLFHGLQDLPQTSFIVSKDIPNCGMLLLTKGIIPAFLKHK